MNIIFVDVDGVLTSVRTGFHNIDIYAVNFLLWICEKSKSKIVISSTWRFNHNKEFFKNIFGDYLHDDFKTPDFQQQSANTRVYRGFEIKDWLEKHPNVKKYLILDDDYDMLDDQQSHFVQTDSYNGILYKDMEKILKYFRIKDFPDEFRELYQHPDMFAFERNKKRKKK